MRHVVSMTDSSQNFISPTRKSNKSRNSNFMVQIQIKLKSRFEFCTTRYREIWVIVSRYRGFRGCGIFSGICHWWYMSGNVYGCISMCARASNIFWRVIVTLRQWAHDSWWQHDFFCQVELKASMRTFSSFQSSEFAKETGQQSTVAKVKSHSCNWESHTIYMKSSYTCESFQSSKV